MVVQAKVEGPYDEGRVVLSRKIMSHFSKCSTEANVQTSMGDSSKEEWYQILHFKSGKSLHSRVKTIYLELAMLS